MSALTEPQQAWVDALRSGEYRQGRSFLRDEQNRYCCLGVACEVARLNGVDVEGRLHEDSGVWEYDGDTSYPPESVVEWLGLASDRGEFNRGTVGTPDEIPTDTLYGLNDHYLWGFEEIADLIEQRPQGLFVEEPYVPTDEEETAYILGLDEEPPKPETEIEF